MVVSFYGKISDPLGTQMEFSLPDCGLRVADIRMAIAKDCQVEALLDPTVRAAVNDEIVLDTHLVLPGDDVTFMSALSGG